MNSSTVTPLSALVLTFLKYSPAVFGVVWAAAGPACAAVLCVNATRTSNSTVAWKGKIFRIVVRFILKDVFHRKLHDSRRRCGCPGRRGVGSDYAECA